MTHRMTRFSGLMLALLIASPLAANGADEKSLAWSEGTATRSTESEAPGALANSDGATWKTSKADGPVEIRFKKPQTVVLTDQPAIAEDEESAAANIPTATAPKLASVEPVETAEPAAAPIAKPSKDAQSANVDAEAKAELKPTKAKAEAPTVEIELSEQPAAAPLPASQPHVDEHVQLVARMFQEDSVGEVPPVPDSEPMPSKSNNTSDTGSSQAKNADDYNYEGDIYGGAYCPPPAPPLIWVGGVEATFLSPDLNSDGVTFLFEEYAHERSDWVSSQSSEIDSLYVAPRIWLGVQGCKWGANVRYWHMYASEGYFDPSLGMGGAWDAYDCGRPDLGFNSCSRFEAYTVDLEVTRRFCLHDCWMQFSAGVRHAELEHGESLIGTALADDNMFMGFAAADRYSRGTGILLGLYGRKPLFPCSCVHWFYNVRWSALWGPTQTGVETAAAVLGQDADAGSINGAYTCVDDNLFIGEIQLGLEWNYALRCMPANAFFRAAVEYQRWDGGQGYSESGSFAGIEVNDDYSAVVETFAASAAPELDLVGFTIGTGLTW